MGITRRGFIGCGTAIAASTAIGNPVRSTLGSLERVAVKTGLPYDSEVEYIEGTGTQWIDTGMWIDADTTLSMRATVLDTGTRNLALLGAGNASGRRAEIYNWIDHLEVYWGNLDKSFTFYIRIGDEILVDIRNGRFSVTNLTSSATSNGDYSFTGRSAYSARLFALIRGSVQYVGHHRIAFVRIGEHEFVPVRFTNEHGVSEGAMYDRMSGELFRNQGTGAFVIGPDTDI